MRMPILVPAVLVLVSNARAQVTFADDFTDGDDADWTHIDFLDMRGFGPTVYDASSGAYRLSSSAELPQMDALIHTGAVVTQSAINPQGFANGAIRGTMRVENDQTNLAYAARLHPEGLAGYLFFFDAGPGGGIGISSFTIFGAKDLVEIPFTLEVGRIYHVEGSFFGPNLAMKVWADGEAEPDMPLISAADGAWTEGAIGVTVFNQPAWAGGVGGRISGVHDDISFTIPSPGAAVLLGLAGLAVRRRRAR